MYSVKINDKDILDTYGFLLTHKEIKFPDVKTSTVSVPGRNGLIDYTDSINGSPRYENREITMEFVLKDVLRNKWTSIITKLSADIHGKKLKISFDDDANYFYFGRIQIDKWDSSKAIGKLKMVADCDPFKYDVQTSVEPWEWDIFDFECGYITELCDVVVDGTIKVYIRCEKMPLFPTFTASSEMNITYKGESYTIPKGSSKIYQFFFEEGENELTVEGHGTISIEYRGGTL